jgi:hypothetical protein
MRRRQQRRQRTRRVLVLSLAAVVVVAIAVGSYLVGGALQGPNSNLIAKPVSASLASTLFSLANAPYGQRNSSYVSQFKTPNGLPITSGSSPIVLYIGAEYCPYCASQRWPLILALMRFGNFSGLSYMESSSTDVYANTATFSFRDVAYKSNYFVFEHYEYQDRTGSPLQTVPDNYTATWNQYGGGIPFIDLANKLVISGASFLPTHMVGLNWTQIAAQIGSGTALGVQIKQVANTFTSALCSVDGAQPPSVCTNPSITGLFLSFQAPPSVSSYAGTPTNAASTWANVQYRQILWITRTSMPTR